MSWNAWKQHLLMLGIGLIDFEGLAGFILFLLILLAVLLWLLYTFLQVIWPALLGACLLWGAAFIPFHYCSAATLRQRCEQQIHQALEDLKNLERLRTPREQRWPLERRVREAAQALANALWEHHRDAQEEYRRDHRKYSVVLALERRLEDLRLGYEVNPEISPWARFVRLHLERSWVRWLAEHPGAARLIVVLTLATTTTAIAAVLFS